MDTYIKVTLSNKTFYLLKQPDDGWLFTQRTPPLYGQDAKEFTVKISSNSQEVVIDTNDQRLIEALTKFVTTKQTPSGDRMIGYYPMVIRTLLEYQALIGALGFEIDFFRSEIYLTMDDMFAHSMDIERVKQWEEALEITPIEGSTFEDRRDVILARIRSGYKLNTNSINIIVSTFTGGTAESWIENSTLYVKITPPAENKKQYRFENVDAEIRRRVPAHLGYNVYRGYATWGDIKNNFTDWQDVNDSFTDWEDVKVYIVPKT